MQDFNLISPCGAPFIFNIYIPMAKFTGVRMFKTSDLFNCVAQMTVFYPEGPSTL